MEPANAKHTMHASPRRFFIRGAVAALAGGAAIASRAHTKAPIVSAPDASIFRLHAEFRGVVSDLRQAYKLKRAPRVKAEAVLYDRLDSIVAQITAARPTTGEGFRAKAAIIAENEAEFCSDGNEESLAEMAMRQSLFADLLAAVGA